MMANTKEEEFDVDKYLENVLEEFDEVPASATVVQEEAPLDEADFMKLLQSNMASLMEPASSEPESFQDKISQTLHKLKSSDDQAYEKAPTADPMDLMMKDLETMMAGGDFEEMFGGLVNQLASRDLLYEPLKDLSDKYPQWIEDNKNDLSAEDLARYRVQFAVVTQIVTIFDATEPGKEPSEEEGKKIMDLMQKMQEFGNPPESLMGGEMPPHVDANSAEMPDIPQECKQM